MPMNQAPIRARRSPQARINHVGSKKNGQHGDISDSPISTHNVSAVREE
jgi:hypothetical protein